MNYSQPAPTSLAGRFSCRVRKGCLVCDSADNSQHLEQVMPMTPELMTPSNEWFACFCCTTSTLCSRTAFLEFPCDLLNGCPNPVPPNAWHALRSPRGLCFVACVGSSLSWIQKSNLSRFWHFSIQPLIMLNPNTPWHLLESSAYIVSYFVTCYYCSKLKPRTAYRHTISNFAQGSNA
jgi:hypothetical protein